MEDDDAEPPANNNGANHRNINANVENADVSNNAATADTGASGVDSITSDRDMSASARERQEEEQVTQGDGEGKVSGRPSPTTKQWTDAIEISSNLSDSQTDAEIENLVNKIHSSQEGKQFRGVCSTCGRQHHPSRTPWTHSNACNPIGVMDFDDDDFHNAEDDLDVAEPHLLHQLPLIFDNTQVLHLLVMSMNLCVAFAVGHYFDERFLTLLREHHRESFPPPLQLQLAHFSFVVLLSFWTLQKFWHTVMLPIDE